MNPYLMLGAALAIAGAYAGGQIDGWRIEQGAQAKLDRAVTAERDKYQEAIKVSATAGQTAEQQRQSNLRSITRENEVDATAL